MPVRHFAGNEKGYYLKFLVRKLQWALSPMNLSCNSRGYVGQENIVSADSWVAQRV